MSKWIVLTLIGLLAAGWFIHTSGMMGPRMDGMMGMRKSNTGMTGMMMGGPSPGATIEPDGLPAAGSAAARAFERVCSGCHALPDPTRHTPQEWPGVIQRMLGNMDRAGRRRPDQQTIDAITGYLEAHARQVSR